MTHKSNDIRTFAVTGHGHSGKTLLTEAMLFKAGAVSRIGSVEQGQTVSDYTAEEKNRVMSIYATPVTCQWKSNQFFIVDCPGYADFFGEVTATVEVCDTVTILIDATAGIEVGSQRVRQYLERRSIPFSIFINKMDKENADFYSALESVQSTFGPKCVPVQVPIGKEASFSAVADVLSGNGADRLDENGRAKLAAYKEKLVDLAAELNDKLLEKYLGGETLSDAEILVGLKAALMNGTFVPVFCGCASKQIGVEEFMDGIGKLFVAPTDKPAKKSASGDSERKPDESDHFSAQVFKNITDPYTGHLTYMRIYSGTLKTSSEIYNSSTKTKERFGHLYFLQGKDHQAVEEAGPGSIIGIAKLKTPVVGDSFVCIGDPDFAYPKFFIPKPMVSFAVHAKNKADDEKVGNGLHKLAEEDPTLIVERNTETHELTISVMGELHLSIVVEKLKSKYHVEAEFSVPKIAYKETIKSNAEGHEKHKKQSGGRGQYGDVYLRVEPQPRGGGYEFVSAIVGGAIPKNFIPAVEKGVHEALNEGMLSGSPVVDIKVTVYDGSYHDVDSSEIAFKIAGAKAFREAFMKANPCLLEPIMDVATTVPKEFMGDITGLYNTKRGRVMGMESLGNFQTVKALVPISEMFNFSNELRSLTSGRGSFIMDFDHYAEVPGMVAKKVTEEYMASKNAEASAH